MGDFEVEFEEEEVIPRLKTYVRGLDEKMEGGIPIGNIVLLCGNAGSMKSTFAFNIIYNSVTEADEKVVYLTLEQSRESILKHMARLGMPVLKNPKCESNLAVVDLGQLRKEIKDIKNVNWLEALINQIKNYKEQLQFQTLVLDSLEALYVLSQMENPRNELFHFFEQLRDLNLTSFLISEMSRDGKSFGTYGIEDFLADGVIHMAIERTGKTVDRYVSVVKMRHTNHDMSYFPLLVSNGFEIVAR